MPKEKTNTRGMLLKRATLQLPVRGRTRAGRRNLTRAQNLRRPPWPARMPTSVGSDVRQTILRIRSTARELDLVAARALPHDQRNVLVVLFSKLGACLNQVSSPKPRISPPPPFMKKAAFILAIAFLTGCAAPPPVKIASKLLGKSLLKQGNDDGQASDGTETTAPQ